MSEITQHIFEGAYPGGFGSRGAVPKPNVADPAKERRAWDYVIDGLYKLSTSLMNKESDLDTRLAMVKFIAVASDAVMKVCPDTEE